MHQSRQHCQHHWSIVHPIRHYLVTPVATVLLAIVLRLICVRVVGNSHTAKMSVSHALNFVQFVCKRYWADTLEFHWTIWPIILKLTIVQRCTRDQSKPTTVFAANVKLAPNRTRITTDAVSIHRNQMTLNDVRWCIGYLLSATVSSVEDVAFCPPNSTALLSRRCECDVGFTARNDRCGTYLSIGEPHALVRLSFPLVRITELVYVDADPSAPNITGLTEGACSKWFGTGSTVSSRGLYCTCKNSSYFVSSTSNCRKKRHCFPSTFDSLCRSLFYSFCYNRLFDQRGNSRHQRSVHLSWQYQRHYIRRCLYFLLSRLHLLISFDRVLEAHASANLAIVSVRSIEHAVHGITTLESLV